MKKQEYLDLKKKHQKEFTKLTNPIMRRSAKTLGARHG